MVKNEIKVFERYKLPSWIRWLLFLPISILLVFLFAIISFNWGHWTTKIQLFFMEGGPTPYVGGLFFILIGRFIAPKYKFYTSVFMTIIYITVAIFVIYYTQNNDSYLIEPNINYDINIAIGLLAAVALLYYFYQKDYKVGNR